MFFWTLLKRERWSKQSRFIFLFGKDVRVFWWSREGDRGDGEFDCMSLLDEVCDYWGEDGEKGLKMKLYIISPVEFLKMIFKFSNF